MQPASTVILRFVRGVPNLMIAFGATDETAAVLARLALEFRAE
ncbi:MAG TPA: hypothetical protein VHY79_16930 [Rhizomicrobium sp.]|nr:hypothetical protein [Rhizomicrobium sp.]